VLGMFAVTSAVLGGYPALGAVVASMVAWVVAVELCNVAARVAQCATCIALLKLANSVHAV